MPAVSPSVTPTVSASPSPSAAASPTPVPVIIVQGDVLDADLSNFGDFVPVAGATVVFINNTPGVNNTTTSFVAVSGPTGFYSVALTPGDYTIVASAPGFETRILQDTFTFSVSRDIVLTNIPFNGFIPYATNPVLETSPGRDVVCTISVINSQVTDQQVTFAVVTPAGWTAWFPDGESLLLQTGQTDSMTFVLRYNGNLQGPHTIKVVVNGGAYSAEIPVIVVVKDLPFEQVDLYSNSYQHEVSPGLETSFQLNVVNYYAQSKHLVANVQAQPPLVAATYSKETNDRTSAFFDYRDLGATGNFPFWLRVYAPEGTKEGTYHVLLNLCGEGVSSNTLDLVVVVSNRSLAYSYLNNTSFSGKPEEQVIIPVTTHSTWDFPIAVQAKAWVVNASVASLWTFTYFSNSSPPGTAVDVLPYDTETIYCITKVPRNLTPGLYPVKISVEHRDSYWLYYEATTLEAVIDVLPGRVVNVTCVPTPKVSKSVDAGFGSASDGAALLTLSTLVVGLLWVLSRLLKKQ